MKILFVDPSGLQNPLPGKPGMGLNLAIATLTSILVKNGHTVSLFDMENIFENRLVNAIEKVVKA
jgi:hypothetical protein|tara:strand:- start:1335 stop:1529 length:195 start_codon:yes stop_codon:yes gene_type:complete